MAWILQHEFGQPKNGTAMETIGTGQLKTKRTHIRPNRRPYLVAGQVTFNFFPDIE